MNLNKRMKHSITQSSAIACIAVVTLGALSSAFVIGLTLIVTDNIKCLIEIKR